MEYFAFVQNVPEYLNYLCSFSPRTSHANYGHYSSSIPIDHVIQLQQCFMNSLSQTNLVDFPWLASFMEGDFLIFVVNILQIVRLH